MEILIIDNEGNKLNLVEKLVPNSKTMNYTKCNNISLDSVSGMVLTGSKHHPARLLQHEKNLIFSAIEKNIPVLGICAGHEVIGLAFGAEIHRYKQKVEGKFEITILDNRNLFKGIQSKTQAVSEHHIHQVSMPQNFELLATSSKTENQAMKMQGKPVFSTQFHAERSRLGQIVFKNFLSLCQ